MKNPEEVLAENFKVLKSFAGIESRVPRTSRCRKLTKKTTQNRSMDHSFVMIFQPIRFFACYINAILQIATSLFKIPIFGSTCPF